MSRFNVYSVAPDGTERFLGTSPGVEFKPKPKPVPKRKMNLFDILNRGARHAPSDADREAQKIKAAAEATRLQWLNALLVDQTRTWMSLGEHAPDILNAMATMLTIAGFVHVYDRRSADTPELRVIRGAISAATQCYAGGAVLTAADARAFRAACDHARTIIEAGTPDAIIHASESIRKTVGL